MQCKASLIFYKLILQTLTKLLREKNDVSLVHHLLKKKIKKRKKRERPTVQEDVQTFIPSTCLYQKIKCQTH